MWNKAIRIFARVFIKPYLMCRLRRSTLWRTEDMDLIIRPGVFHPKYFYSTRFLLDYLKKISLRGWKVLEVGSGSGCLSVFCAKQGAMADALDIHPAAVENTLENAARNAVVVNAIISDLFSALPARQYDLLLVNPPYYPKNPLKPEEYAWYCGEDFEYFNRFFTSFRPFVAEEGRVLMVLSETCMLSKIAEVAENYGCGMQVIRSKTIRGEKLYLYAVISMKETISQER